MSAHTPLTHNQLRELAPTLFTQSPHEEVSEKYHFIPTIDVVNQIASHGWYPVSVQEASVRDADKEGYQRHLVRFRHFDDLIHPGDNAVELLLFNSHDRTTAFSIAAGVYRFVCANGLVIAESVFERYAIRHIGDREDDVAQAVARILEVKPLLERKIHTLSTITLNEREKLSFAKAALPLRFEEHLQVDPHDAIIPHRQEDEKDDLYTVMNVVQENLMRGDLAGVNTQTGRHFTSKAITSISKDVQLNQGLWDIAERIAQIKHPPQPMAA
jgi:hypothetical protein